MAKIVLGQRPTHFNRAVKFLLLDGSTAWINVNYKYRTRSEYGAFVDENVERHKQAAEAAIAEAIKAAEQAKAEAGDGKDGATEGQGAKLPGMKDVLEKSSSDSIEFILGAADGWNLDAPFTREAVVQLVDEYPQAALAIVETYRLACTEGRQGN
jgi:hypothetical protein